MIAYADTSAVVPLFLDEPSTPVARQLWDAAERVATVRITYVEARAALAMAERGGRITADELTAIIPLLDGLTEMMNHLEIDETLTRRAGELAQLHGLRAYDAVHLAAAESLAGDRVVLLSGDVAMCEAARELGLLVAQT